MAGGWWPGLCAKAAGTGTGVRVCPEPGAPPGRGCRARAWPRGAGRAGPAPRGPVRRRAGCCRGRGRAEAWDGRRGPDRQGQRRKEGGGGSGGNSGKAGGRSVGEVGGRNSRDAVRLAVVVGRSRRTGQLEVAVGVYAEPRRVGVYAGPCRVGIGAGPRQLTATERPVQLEIALGHPYVLGRARPGIPRGDRWPGSAPPLRLRGLPLVHALPTPGPRAQLTDGCHRLSTPRPESLRRTRPTPDSTRFTGRRAEGGVSGGCLRRGRWGTGRKRGTRGGRGRRAGPES